MVTYSCGYSNAYVIENNHYMCLIYIHICIYLCFQGEPRLFRLEKTKHRLACGYKHMKSAGRKHPDCLTDSCKHSSVNRMAAGLRLSRYNHGFCFFHFFKHVSHLADIFQQTEGPSVLQIFSL